MAICRFYRDPLRNVDSKCSKTVIINFIHQNVCLTIKLLVVSIKTLDSKKIAVKSTYCHPFCYGGLCAFVFVLAIACAFAFVLEFAHVIAFRLRSYS